MYIQSKKLFIPILCEIYFFKIRNPRIKNHNIYNIIFFTY